MTAPLIAANETTLIMSPRVVQASAMFDVAPSERARQEWPLTFDLDEQEWHVGLIVGPSGAGKSTVARTLFGDRMIAGFTWSESRSLLDDFPESMSIKDIVGLLTAVGFGSAPAWLRPFHTLSNGEQFRVTMARALAEYPEFAVIDEFTSVVDRQVAQVASHTVQKAVRRRQGKFVAVTCHYDVLDWLQPDWVYQPHTNTFAWRCLQQRPTFDLRVHPIDTGAWRLFKHHHYMSADIHHGAQCFGGFIDQECVAFTSYLHFPHAKTKNIKMGHRLVVLPDYQGLGIGGRLDDWLGQYLYARGYRYRNVVAHPAMIAYYSRSPRWHMTASAGQVRHGVSDKTTNAALRHKQLQSRRLSTYSFEYRPAA